MSETSFNLQKLIHDVFRPKPGERVLFMVDAPRPGIDDSMDWEERRAMAIEWADGFAMAGLTVEPLLSYPAVGANNGPLPPAGIQEGNRVSIPDALDRVGIVVAMTEYSATAPLSVAAAERGGRLRGASMPGVLRRMEKTALAADYSRLAQRVNQLKDLLDHAVSADLVFTTGDKLHVDLRHRSALADDGLCIPGKPFPIINLPSGEAFIVPYEGENKDDPSQTRGTMPYPVGDGLVTVRIEANLFVDAEGPRVLVEEWRKYFETDNARRNLAELGLGCNDRAIVTGCVLEDEKAGLHLAHGRSDHLGGTVGPGNFACEENVEHQDIVYTEGCPAGMREATLEYADGAREQFMKDNRYLVWSQ